MALQLSGSTFILLPILCVVVFDQVPRSLQALNSILRWLRGVGRSSARVSSDPDKAKLNAAMHGLRIRHITVFVPFLSGISATMTLARISLHLYRESSVWQLPKVMPSIMIYGLTRIFEKRLIQLTPLILDGLALALYVIVAFRFYVDGNTVTGNGARTSAYIIIGMFVLDYRKSLLPNMIYTAFVIWASLPSHTTSVALDRSLGSILYCELTGFGLSTMALVVFESVIKARIFAQLSAQESEQSKHAARKLLAVTCDADVLLDSELRIVGPDCMRLSALLSPEAGQLEHSHFQDCLVETDAHRFNEIISRTASLGSCDIAKAPASALNVQLRNATKQNSQVKLFHVAIPPLRDSDRLHHLIGIRECDESVPLQAAIHPDEASDSELPGRSAQRMALHPLSGRMLRASMQSGRSRLAAPANSSSNGGPSGSHPGARFQAALQHLHLQSHGTQLRQRNNSPAKSMGSSRSRAS